LGRRRAREFALQVLYQADMRQVGAPEALEMLWATQLEVEGLSGTPADTDEVAFAKNLVEGVASNAEDIDAHIEKASLNWRLSRMPVVDRNILRLATFEILLSKDVPTSVSINEAVELAKRFGEKESGAFVNGILDRIAQETGRGGRGKGKGKKKGSKSRRS
jgi:N utilization substance protein B